MFWISATYFLLDAAKSWVTDAEEEKRQNSKESLFHAHLYFVKWFCSIPEWNDWHQTTFAHSFMMKMEVFKTPD